MHQATEPSAAPDPTPPQRRPAWQTALIGLFVLAIFATLYVASALFIPIALAILFRLLLMPPVRKLSRLGLPRAAGAGLVVLLLVGALGGAAASLAAPASAWLDRAPTSMVVLRMRLAEIRKPLDEIREATEKMTEATQSDEEQATPEVVVRQPGWAESVLSQAGTVVASAALMLVLLYFMLATGDSLLRSMLRRSKRRGERKRTVEMFRRAEQDISAYLITVTLINLALGIVTGIAMWALGMPTPMLWGALAAITNFVPFLGAAATLAVIGVVSLLTFSQISLAIIPPLVFFALTTLEGQFITPSLIGRRLTISPVAVFLALMVWGWMWGIPGMLLAVPMLATFKLVCDSVPRLNHIGALLDRR
ncbi:AI-2E family transporter [Caenispirillum salinarum]|uniref:AI-2E family transporter n=1 Tax=Caenispirillum salinarum TaxID=859058 RepID=UPI00384BDD73